MKLPKTQIRRSDRKAAEQAIADNGDPLLLLEMGHFSLFCLSVHPPTKGFYKWKTRGQAVAWSPSSF